MRLVKVCVYTNQSLMRALYAYIVVYYMVVCNGLRPGRYGARNARATARLVRPANWAFLLFGLGAVVAVPEPQAILVLLALLGQAVASRWTLPGTA
jgi:hypothetical protein